MLKQLPIAPAGREGWPWTTEFDAAAYDIYPDWPRISIITPSYNQGDFIEETIRSILLQNYPNLEYIVMDGGSTDDTVKVLDSYRPWLTHAVSEKDGGQSNAINNGIRILTGDIVNWINSDDFLLPGALFHIGKYFREHPDIDLIYCNAHTLYVGNGPVKTVPYDAAEYDLFDFISRISIHQPATFWRTSLFAKAGILDESLHFCMDYDLWMRIMFDCRHAKLPVEVSAFRRHAYSKSSNFDDQSNVYKEYRIILSRLFDSIYPEAKTKLRQLGLYQNDEGVTYRISRKFENDLLRKMLDTYILVCGLQEYTAGNRKEANRLLIRSFNKTGWKRALIHLLKNNMNIRKIFHPYRKV